MTTITIDNRARTVAEGLKSCTLPYAKWTHEAHWLTAFVFTLEEEEPLEAISKAIFRYNDQVGTPNSDTDGFHATITAASMAAAQALAAEANGTVSDIVTDLMAGPLGSMHWLERHYSPETLWSLEARKAFIAPDREPLPKL